MGVKLPDDVLHRIKVRLDCGESIKQIRDATKVSRAALFRLRLNFDLFGQPYAPQSVVLGRPRALLPAQELVMYTVTQGSIIAEVCFEFVQDRVLPHCSAYPGPRSVLILDNATIHKSAELRDMCEEKGVLLKFLPPYSPDYNPIENTFKDLKAWIKRNYILATDFDDFGNFLEFAIGQCRGLHARQHFIDAGYVVN